MIAPSYGESPEIYEYSYAVVRLFDFYYWGSPPIIDRVLDADVLDLDLGEPLGEHRTLGSVYYELYERGWSPLTQGVRRPPL
ncbi:MAG: hypothetical protein DRK00_06985 [Thermoprotei archaeon]|nr:MAG: hypothetical protein DRK00_06985 [Thermoprotei archaeon]